MIAVSFTSESYLFLAKIQIRGSYGHVMVFIIQICFGNEWWFCAYCHVD